MNLFALNSSDQKYLSIKQAISNVMSLEEMAKKYSMKDLRPLAKKYGISLRCAKKIDVLKALPPEGLAELESN
jgi:hypothetical protein